ncbi:hypothetical protein EC973_007949 [Apophysomyces ossiformis]|uniref:ubiquitinyl hydrolase 1 n=1 Tax=Apophysomyces ossiformis TaxID=679940 RepID=A0A8H7BP32_9FUNG|nr:hypothetical protein EC973_007949 [Apophysomyces ossiformis]
MATEPELTDEQILEFEQRIKDEEAQKIPLVCQTEPISKLEEEFKGNTPFLRKIKVEKNVSTMRILAKDTTKFVDAAEMATAFLESLLRDNDKYKAALAKIKSTENLLELGGFQKLAYEDFYEVALEQFERLPSYAFEEDIFLANFQSEEISNAIVMYLRFVASAYLRIHAAEYEPFLVVEMISIDEFCSMHVEAFGRESDHLQIIALTKALDVPVQVVYLDGSADSVAAVHEFWPVENNKDSKPLRLIYRPGELFVRWKQNCLTCLVKGHYDLLYERQCNWRQMKLFSGFNGKVTLYKFSFSFDPLDMNEEPQQRDAYHSPRKHGHDVTNSLGSDDQRQGLTATFIDQDRSEVILGKRKEPEPITDNESENDEDTQMQCCICSENWVAKGAHRLVSLKKPAKKGDIRPIHPIKIAALDMTEITQLRTELDAAETTLVAQQKTLDNMKLALNMRKRELARISEEHTTLKAR